MSSEGPAGGSGRATSPSTATARDAGQAAVYRMRQLLARKAAELIRNDPDAARAALEMGLVDREWLENRGRGPITTAAPSEVLQRFLEHAVEARPSRLSTLGLGAAQLLAGRHAGPSGVPLHMTVLFTDLEGFTSFTADNGDRAALAMLREHHRDAGPVVRRHGGHVVKRLGDGLLCRFPGARSGLRAAVELLGTAPTPLRLRAGVHVGEAMAGPDDVIGHVVNVAARVAESARGGQALATGSAIAEAGPMEGVRVGRGRSRRLKGLAERVVVHEIAPEPAPGRSGKPAPGRSGKPAP